MGSSGFLRCQADHCCYVENLGNSFIILRIYVDDMLIVGGNKRDIDKLKGELSKEFDMKDLGATKQILGMRTTRNSVVLRLSQEEYMKKELSRFSMGRAKSVSTPLETHFKLSKEQSPTTEDEQYHMAKVLYACAIGSLMHAMVCTRLDIAHTKGVVSR